MCMIADGKPPAFWFSVSERSKRAAHAPGINHSTAFRRLGRIAMSESTGTVRAEGRVIHRGRTVAAPEGDPKDRAGKLYAHATTTCMV